MNIKSLVSILILVTIITIRVGEKETVLEPTFNYPGLSILYCGMLMTEPRTFSIPSNRYRNAINVYYPIDIKSFRFHGRLFKVIKVTPLSLKIEDITNRRLK